MNCVLHLTHEFLCLRLSKLNKVGRKQGKKISNVSFSRNYIQSCPFCFPVSSVSCTSSRVNPCKRKNKSKEVWTLPAMSETYTRLFNWCLTRIMPLTECPCLDGQPYCCSPYKDEADRSTKVQPHFGSFVEI